MNVFIISKKFSFYKFPVEHIITVPVSFLIGGEKKMLVWNDLEADEKIKVYDKGVEVTTGEAVYQQLVSYRTGDMWAPKVEQLEALKVEASRLLNRAPLMLGGTKIQSASTSATIATAFLLNDAMLSAPAGKYGSTG